MIKSSFLYRYLFEQENNTSLAGEGWYDQTMMLVCINTNCFVASKRDTKLGCDGQMVSASDSQPHDRGFESCVSQLAHQKMSCMGYG